MAGISSAGGGGVLQKRSATLSGAVQALRHAQESESWGLLLEAAEDYLSASFELKHASLPEVDWFSEDEKVVLAAVGSAFYQKYQKLTSVSRDKDADECDGVKLCEVLEDFASGSCDLPALRAKLKCLLPSSDLGVGSGVGGGRTLAEAAAEMEQRNLQAFLDMPDSEYEAALEKAGETRAGSLLKRRDVLPGYSYLDIDIEKIDLKDSGSYVDPFITVSVKGLKGEDIELSQDTPMAVDKEEAAILFRMTAQLQHPLEEMPGGAAIFFEFKHFKPKKKCVSTKCFSFMGMDELKEGKTVLEIYKKPTDFKRKKLTLLSAKPQYLHLNLAIRKP